MFTRTQTPAYPCRAYPAEFVVRWSRKFGVLDYLLVWCPSCGARYSTYGFDLQAAKTWRELSALRVVDNAHTDSLTKARNDAAVKKWGSSDG